MSRYDIDDVIAEILHFDIASEVNRISNRVTELLRTKLKKRGLVCAVSGGIDSSVSAALAVQSVTKAKVLALLLPEQDSSSSSTELGQKLVDHLQVPSHEQNISDALSAIGCYKWRDEAFAKTFPGYNNNWKTKIVISGGGQGKINHFKLIAQDQDGNEYDKTLGLNEYLAIVAATNYKQRIRKTIEYFHADRLNYAVVGTPNRVEYDQGFFVKNGDGSADIKPIAHLYKSQVYMMAEYLGLPKEICSTVPTTDTYSLSQGQDEFYYGLPYKKMDVALWCFNNKKSAKYLAEMLGFSGEKAEFIYTDISRKRKTTAYLHWPALLVDPVPEIECVT